MATGLINEPMIKQAAVIYRLKTNGRRANSRGQKNLLPHDAGFVDKVASGGSLADFDGDFAIIEGCLQHL